jgi:transposase
MNLNELAQYISDEEKAEQVLREIGILKRYTTCPFCGENHIGRVRRFKIKCYRCNKEWGVRRGVSSGAAAIIVSEGESGSNPRIISE